MNKKIKISLVIITLMMLIGSISLIYFNTREEKKAKEQIENAEGLNNNVDDDLITIPNNSEQIDSQKNKSENIDDSKVVNEKDSSTINKTTDSNISNNSSDDNQSQTLPEKNQNTEIEVPSPSDISDENSNLENDEEYLKIYNSCEFYTYSECQSASERIGAELAFDNNVRNTACESFAYKGKIVGYRVQIFFNDGTWKYNN